MDGPRRVTLRVDQNGAEELTPPGQAILVRGMETINKARDTPWRGCSGTLRGRRACDHCLAHRPLNLYCPASRI